MVGKVRFGIYYHGPPPLISFCINHTATVQAMSNARRPSASCMPRAPLIGGCGHTSGMKRGEKSKSPWDPGTGRRDRMYNLVGPAGHQYSVVLSISEKMLGHVLVFSVSTCPFCRRAKKLLSASDLQVPYVDVNLEKTRRS